MSTNKIVLVTGATGFIGGHVIETLYKRGYKVRATVRSTKEPKRTEYLKQLCPNLELLEADLLKEGSFDGHAKGCDYVLHIASPVNVGVGDPQTTLIDPAVKGTLNILEACKKSGTVKRLVITSSAAALRCYNDDNGPEYVYDEKDWNKKSTITENPYGFAKTIAEKSAWEYISKPENKSTFDLVTILPSVCVGPIHNIAVTTESVKFIKDLFITYPAPPAICLGFVDVRDVALAHVLALEIHEAGGNRYVVSNKTLFFVEVSKMLIPHFPEYNLSTHELPNFVVYLAGLFDRRLSISNLYHQLNVRLNLNTQKVQNELKLQYSSIEQALIDTVNSLIHLGIIPDKRVKK